MKPPNWTQLKKLGKLSTPAPIKTPRGLAAAHPSVASAVATMGGNALYRKRGPSWMKKIGKGGGEGGTGDSKKHERGPNRPH